MFDVVERSIADLRAALESGAVTSVDLVHAYLARIDAYDPLGTATALNAVVVRNPDALSEAEASTLIVSGFIEPLVKELPMEYAVEMNKLIQLQMEGSVG